MDAAYLDLIKTISLAALPVVAGTGLAVAKSVFAQRGWRTDTLDAAARGAASGYAYMAANNIKITDPGALSQAVTVGTQYMANRIPDTLAKMSAQGLTQPGVRDIVTAELGKLLAADPAVTVKPIVVPPVPAL